ncbi:hypothetical protein SAMN05421752_102402 [Natronorubrum thiooxidans]|uniref:TAT (Twin-arginine translocation) pathway signal sequence n=1 Tax=Natronorubrum thiooxidans TaxID=308853 RepID=A0A1N7DNM3_9EURY|nr:hypothetical protein SAMN05421752_102402 [Natronorubrum thiooxidans]
MSASSDHASVGSGRIGLETQSDDMRRARQTRRRVLQATGVTVSTALLAGCGGPGEEDPPADSEAEDDEPAAEEGTGNGQERDDDEGIGDSDSSDEEASLA